MSKLLSQQFGDWSRIPVEGQWVVRLTTEHLETGRRGGRIVILDRSVSVVVRDRGPGDWRFHEENEMALLHRRWMALCNAQLRDAVDLILGRVNDVSWRAFIDIHDQELTNLAERLRTLRGLENAREESCRVDLTSGLMPRLLFYLNVRAWLCDVVPFRCRALVE